MMAIADIPQPAQVVDVSDLLDQARQRGDFVMFEGAQGAAGYRPRYLPGRPLTPQVAWRPAPARARVSDYVLGIIKRINSSVQVRSRPAV